MTRKLWRAEGRGAKEVSGWAERGDRQSWAEDDAQDSLREALGRHLLERHVEAVVVHEVSSQARSPELARDLDAVLHRALGADAERADVDVAPARRVAERARVLVLEVEQALALGRLKPADEVRDLLEGDMHADEVGLGRDRRVGLGQAEVLDQIVVPASERGIKTSEPRRETAGGCRDAPSTDGEDLALGRLAHALDQHARLEEPVRQRRLEDDPAPDAELGREKDGLGDLASRLAQRRRQLRKAVAEQVEHRLERVCTMGQAAISWTSR